MTQRHGDALLKFSRANARLNNPQWRRVMFSDVSKLYLRCVDDRKRVWRRRRERPVPATVIPRVTFHSGGFVVSTGISSTVNCYLIFTVGNLNGKRYIDKLLRTYGLPFLPDARHWHDNARLHWTVSSMTFSKQKNVNRMDWPAKSPNLSCIEHVWDVLGRAVSTVFLQSNPSSFCKCELS